MLKGLDDRKKRILQAVVQDYISSAEPVGSRTLARKYDLGVSSATIRNEMADLEMLGYLEHIHTSSGRIPSSKGYRLYVDSLLPVQPMSEEEKAVINKWYQNKAFLAFLPEKESREIIDQIDFEEYTHKTVRNKKDLEEQLKQFRMQGYSIDDQEIEEGLWCAAIPIYDGSRRMVAAISVSGPIERMLSKKDKIISELLMTGKKLSEQLGYH